MEPHNTTKDSKVKLILGSSLISGVVGGILAFYATELRRWQDLRVQQAKTSVRVIDEQTRLGEEMDEILAFWKLQKKANHSLRYASTDHDDHAHRHQHDHQDASWNTFTINHAADEWAANKYLTPADRRVNDARRTLMASYNKLMMLHSLNLIDPHTLKRIPGQFRAQLFLNNVKPLDDANARLYFQRKPQSSLWHWLEEQYSIKPQRPLDS